MPGPLDEVVLGAYERAKERAAAEGRQAPTLGQFVDGQARALESRGDVEKGRRLRDYLAQGQAAELPTRARESAAAYEGAVLQGIRPMNPLAGTRGTRMTSGQAAELEQARAEKDEAAGLAVRAPVAPDAVLPYSNVDPSRMVDLLEAAGVPTKGLLEGDVRKRFYEQFGEQVLTDEAAAAVGSHLWRQRAANVQAEEAQGAETRGEAIAPQDFTRGDVEHSRTYVRDVEAQRQARAADRAAASPFATAMRENLLGPVMEGGAGLGSLFRKDPVTGADVATVLTGGGTDALLDVEAREVVRHAMETPELAIIRGAVRGAADLLPLAGATRAATAALAAAKVPAEVAAPLGRALGMGMWSGLTTSGAPAERAQAALQGALMVSVAHAVSQSPLLQRTFSVLPARASNAVTEALGFLAGEAAVRGGDLSTEDAVHALVLGAFQGAQAPRTPAEARLFEARRLVRAAAEQAGVIRVGPDGRASIDPALIRTPDEAAAAAMEARIRSGHGTTTEGVPVASPRGRAIREAVGPVGPPPPRRILAGTTGDRTAVPPEPVPKALPEGQRAPTVVPRWQQGEEGAAMEAAARAQADEALRAPPRPAPEPPPARPEVAPAAPPPEAPPAAPEAAPQPAEAQAGTTADRFRIHEEIDTPARAEAFVERAKAKRPSDWDLDEAIRQARMKADLAQQEANLATTHQRALSSVKRWTAQARRYEGVADALEALRGAPAPAAAPAPPAAPPAAPAPRRRILRTKQHERAVAKVAEQRKDLRRMEDERFRDTKTGIRNADAWEAAKAREVGEGREVLRIDLGEFKGLNDALGHEAGDRALGKVGARLREAAAEVGIPERNLFRTGGDEFTVAGTSEQIGRLREALAKRGPVEEGGRQVHLDTGTGATPEAADLSAREAKAARKKAAGIGTREQEAAKAAASAAAAEPGKGEGEAGAVASKPTGPATSTPEGARQGEPAAAPRPSPMASARTDRALDRTMRYQGKPRSRREIVEELVAAGAKVTEAKADGRGRRIQRADETYLDEKTLGKAAIDYAERLIRGEATAAAPKPPAEPKPAPPPDPAEAARAARVPSEDSRWHHGYRILHEKGGGQFWIEKKDGTWVADVKDHEAAIEFIDRRVAAERPLPKGHVEKAGRAEVVEPAKPGEDDGEGPQQRPQGPLPADTPSVSWQAYIKRAIATLPKPVEQDVNVNIGGVPGKPERVEARPAIVYGEWAIAPEKVVPAVEPVEGAGPAETRTEHPVKMLAEKGTRWQVVHVDSGLKAFGNISKAEAQEMVLRLRAAKPDLSRLGKHGVPSEEAQKVLRHAWNEMRMRLGQTGRAELIPIRGIPFTAKRRAVAVEDGVAKIDAETLPEESTKGFTPGTARDPRGFAAQFAEVGWDGKFDVVDAPLVVTQKVTPRYGSKVEEVRGESERYLSWKDPVLGVEVRVHPGAFGLDPVALAGAKRVEFDLDSLNIKRPRGSKMGRQLSPDVSFAGALDALSRSGAAEVVWRTPGEKPGADEVLVSAGEEPIVASDRMDDLPASLSDTAAPDPVLEAPSPRNGFAMDLPPMTQGPTAEWKGKRVPATRLIRSLVKAIEGIPIRTGGMGKAKRKAAGFFKVGPETIRLREANDLPTAVHEAGHAIEKIVYWNESKTPGAIPALSGKVGDQLTRLGRMLYGSIRPNGGYKREGFAEFLRGWMFGKPDVGAHAPDVLAWWEGTFLKANPRVAKRLAAAKELAQQYVAQGRENAYAASIVRSPDRTGRWKRMLRLVKTRMVEAGDALADMATFAEARTGKPLQPSDDPFAVLTGLRLTHSARARYMVENGMIDVAGNARGGSLREATSIVSEFGRRKGWSKQQTIDRFTLYLWGRRAIERITRRASNPGMSLEDARALVTEFQSPEFSLAAEKIHRWNKGLLDYAVSGRALTRKEANTILGGSREYIPLQRAVERLDGRAIARAVQGGTPLRRFRGSGEAIRDPFAVMAENAEKMVRWTHERMVSNAVVGLSKVEGMGRFVERIPREVAARQVGLERIRKQLEDAGADLSGADPDAIITFFTPKETTPRGKPIIAHQNRSGGWDWYEVDPAVYEAIHGLDVARLPAWVDATFGRAARTLRLGTTGLRATFSLVTNPIRDAFTGYLQSTHRDNPAKYVAEQTRATANEALRLFGKDSPYSDLFRRLGGEQALPLGQDTRHTRRAVRELFSGRGWKGRAVRVVSTPIEHLRDLLQFPESATRVAELRRAADAVGWKPGASITVNQMLQMLTAAKRVTVDFTAAGTWARSVNQVIPFFNASIQGARSFGRTMRERPLAAVLKGVTARTLPALLLWWKNKDEDWYRDMPWREKFSNFWLPVGDSELVAVPRVYDWDNAFSVLPEAILDSIYRQDPEAAAQAVGNLFSTSPLQYLPWSPTEGFRWGIAGENPLLGEALEQASNRDTFTGQRIVPEGEKDLPAREQAAPYTSGIARFIGDRLGWSPRRIDHALRGFTGGLVHDTADLIDALGRLFTGKDPGIGMRGPSRGEFKDVPVVGAALGRRGGREGIGSLAVERLYDALGEARKGEASREARETPEARLRRLTLEDAGRAVKWLRVLQGAASTQAERQAIQREIRSIAQQALGQAGRRRFLREAKEAEDRARAATSAAGGGRRILRPR